MAKVGQAGFHQSLAHRSTGSSIVVNKKAKREGGEGEMDENTQAHMGI